MIGVYLSLFASIRRTRNATPLAPNELEIAIRFFFIVFTDVACWLPTIALKIAALFGLHVPANLYAWYTPKTQSSIHFYTSIYHHCLFYRA